MTISIAEFVLLPDYSAINSKHFQQSFIEHLLCKRSHSEGNILVKNLNESAAQAKGTQNTKALR